MNRATVIPLVWLVLVLTFFLATAAEADTSPSVLKDTCKLFLTGAIYLRSVAFVLGACSFALISIQASIAGKFDSRHLISIFGGLFVVSFIAPFIGFVTGQEALTCPGIGRVIYSPDWLPSI